MVDRVTYKKDWKLTQEALDKFLSCLSPDPDARGAEYLKIYQRFYYFFERNNVADPDRLVDISIDRAARMIMAGEEVRNPAAYLTGIARNVLREYWKSPEMRVEGLDGDLPAGRTPAGLPPPSEEEKIELERRLDCLERCAKTLPEAERQHVIDYYYEEKRAKINRRKQIAEELGISQGALRVRMHRIRERLETCITKCLQEHSEAEKHFERIPT
ncbi:MAG TPA: RNA polymerase sigma factor [Blastocatellia bacterium]|nr:RNA polymerase sigma factor [Blastocatellia bacterium]